MITVKWLKVNVQNLPLYAYEGLFTMVLRNSSTSFYGVNWFKRNRIKTWTRHQITFRETKIYLIDFFLMLTCRLVGFKIHSVLPELAQFVIFSIHSGMCSGYGRVSLLIVSCCFFYISATPWRFLVPSFHFFIATFVLWKIKMTYTFLVQ